MICKTCFVMIPYGKAKDLDVCPQCGQPFIDESKDVLRDGKYGLVKEIRDTQVEMVEDIEKFLKSDNHVFLVEGGTGIGKSYAYLVPSILQTKQENIRRVIVSTATKTLQGQLTDKDVEAVLKALDPARTISYTIYKGRANYACWLSAKNVPSNERDKFQQFIAKAVEEERPADKAAWPGDPPKWWADISTEDCGAEKTCLHYQYCCPHPSEYDLVITNHSLLAFNTMLNNTLLAPHDLLIIDEGHQLIDAFRLAHSVKLRLKSLQAAAAMLSKYPDLRECVNKTKYKEEDGYTPRTTYTYDGESYTPAAAVSLALASLLTSFTTIYDYAKTNKEEDSTINPSPVWGSFQTLLTTAAYVKTLVVRTIINLSAAMHSLETDETDVDKQFGMTLREVMLNIARSKRLIKRIDSAINFVGVVESGIHTAGIPTHILTCDKKEENILLVQPIHVEQHIRNCLNLTKRVISLSATMTINGNFDYIKKEMGIANTQSIMTRIYKSPFNLSDNTLLYLPKHVPLPEHEPGPARDAWVAMIASEIVRLTEISEGNALVLFTSNKDLSEVQDYAKGILQSKNLTIFAQGIDGETQILLQRFKDTDRSILFGVKSFWEGIDIQGDKLKMLIITKLPLANPFDPLVSALSKEVTREGRNAFDEISAPRMYLTMRQGVGRLIRSMQDKGCVAILDPRIWTSSSKAPKHLARLEWTKVTGTPYSSPHYESYGRTLYKILGYKQVTEHFPTLVHHLKKLYNKIV